MLLSIPRLLVAAERQVVQLAHAARPTDCTLIPPIDIRLACTPPFFLSLSTVVEAQLPIAVLSAMVTAVIQPAVAASVAHDMDSE